MVSRYNILATLLVIANGAIAATTPPPPTAAITTTSNSTATAGISDICNRTLIKFTSEIPCPIQYTQIGTKTKLNISNNCPMFDNNPNCSNEMAQAAINELDTNCKSEGDARNRQVMNVYENWLNISLARLHCTKDEDGSYCDPQWNQDPSWNSVCKKCTIQGYANVLTKWSPPQSRLNFEDKTMDALKRVMAQNLYCRRNRLHP
ncbi:hypothetical protein BDF22DRAFT_259756 [Syncephalis plumigaleata]|nr:hypothetical protein BDF22DRAFT_259756 [Syncephalis plumigaleata]